MLFIFEDRISGTLNRNQMYLAQTNLEVDTQTVYLFGIVNPVRVYLTKEVDNASTQIVVKKAFDETGRDAEILQLTADRKRMIQKIS